MAVMYEILGIKEPIDFAEQIRQEKFKDLQRLVDGVRKYKSQSKQLADALV